MLCPLFVIIAPHRMDRSDLSQLIQYRLAVDIATMQDHLAGCKYLLYLIPDQSMCV